MKLKLVIFKLTWTFDSLEYKELILLLLVHHEVFSTEDSNPVLISRFLKSNNLVRLPSICAKKLNWNGSAKLKSRLVIHEYLINFSDKYQIAGENLYGFGPLEVLVINTDPKIVHEFPLVDIKAPLIGLVGDRVSDL